MKMLSQKSFVGLVAAVLATACVGFASWGSHKSSDRGTDVTFVSTAKFNDGVTLPAGTYRMEVPENSKTPEVTFYQENGDPSLGLQVGKAMATVKAQTITQQKKNANTEIDAVTSGNAQLVKEIRPRGWDETLLFASAGQDGSAESTQ